jgi:hypothetical protein
MGSTPKCCQRSLSSQGESHRHGRCLKLTESHRRRRGAHPVNRGGVFRQGFRFGTIERCGKRRNRRVIYMSHQISMISATHWRSARCEHSRIVPGEDPVRGLGLSDSGRCRAQSLLLLPNGSALSGRRRSARLAAACSCRPARGLVNQAADRSRHGCQSRTRRARPLLRPRGRDSERRRAPTRTDLPS